MQVPAATALAARRRAVFSAAARPNRYNTRYLHEPQAVRHSRRRKPRRRHPIAWRATGKLRPLQAVVAAVVYHTPLVTPLAEPSPPAAGAAAAAAAPVPAAAAASFSRPWGTVKSLYSGDPSGTKPYGFRTVCER